ncbi:MAG TPA: PEP-CTERM sorting domain-containing protein [Povalibacter sp.]
MNVANRKWLVPVLVVGLGAVFAESAIAVPITFSAAGSNAASIQSTVDTFRAALGGPDNGTAAGTQPSGRRELDWDFHTTGTVTFTSPTTSNFFEGHGAVLTTPGTGFLIFPYGDEPFSSPNVLSPIGSNVLDVFFTVPLTADPAATRGFGAVFTDVDLAATTSLSFFDSANNSLGTFYASTFNNGLSFLGVTFTDPLEMIARARITLGTTSGADVVSLDDLMFGEPSAIETTPPPQSVPEPGTLALFGLALAGLGFARRRRAAPGVRTP